MKENFICVDENGLMYSFSVEANTIKDGGKLPDDVSMPVNNFNSLAIKKDYILFGDIEGNILKWDVKNRVSKNFSFKQRGEIRKLRFAPGKENLLLLIFFLDSIEIVEAANFESVSSFKPPSTATSLATSLTGTKCKILDCDWCSSDKVLILFSDGIIRVFDLNFKQQSNLINCVPSLSRFTDDHLSSKIIDLDEILALKNIFLDTIDSNTASLSQESLAKTYFVSNKSSQLILKDLVGNLNSEFRSLLQTNKSDNEDAASKVKLFCLFSSYFNLGSFEAKFWSIFCACVDQSEGIENQFSYLANNFDFQKAEYSKLKFYREKQHLIPAKNNDLIQDLILCNELDLVFNILMETEPQTEKYLDNYLK